MTRGNTRSIAVVFVIVVLLVAAVLVPTGCASDATESDEYQDLEQELAAVEVQLADMTAERDALATEATATSSRHEKAQATQETILAIMADPRAFGTEDEVVDLLDEMAAPGTVYGDAAFGSTGLADRMEEHTVRSGGRNHSNLGLVVVPRRLNGRFPVDLVRNGTQRRTV